MNEWPGTDAEKLSLYRAVKNNCGCEFGIMNAKIKQAGCHDLLVPTNNIWKRLLFMKRQAGRLLVEELGPQRRVVPAPKYTPHHLNTIVMMGRR